IVQGHGLKLSRTASRWNSERNYQGCCRKPGLWHSGRHERMEGILEELLRPENRILLIEAGTYPIPAPARLLNRRLQSYKILEHRKREVRITNYPPSVSDVRLHSVTLLRILL